MHRGFPGALQLSAHFSYSPWSVPDATSGRSPESLDADSVLAAVDMLGGHRIGHGEKKIEGVQAAEKLLTA
jgi:hypothetical protein